MALSAAKAGGFIRSGEVGNAIRAGDAPDNWDRDVAADCAAGDCGESSDVSRGAVSIVSTAVGRVRAAAAAEIERAEFRAVWVGDFAAHAGSVWVLPGFAAAVFV